MEEYKDMEEYEPDEDIGEDSPVLNQYGQEIQAGDTGEEELLGFSEPKALGGLYALFGDTIEREDTTRVSNLSSTEIGNLGITMRDCKRISVLAKTFRHPKFAKYFDQQANITSDTAMSHKGWLAELFVTSKKFAQRETSNLSLPEQKKKWKMFSKQNTVNDQ